MTGTINDINNLKFYTAKGYEIPMQKSYVLTWELVPGKITSQYLHSIPKGYFIGDVDYTENNEVNILSNSLQAGFIDNGELFIRFASEATVDENGMRVFAYNETITPADYYNYIQQLLLNNENNIKVSINIKNTSYTYTFAINNIFEWKDVEILNNQRISISDYFNIKTIYVGENLDENTQEYYQLAEISKFDLTLLAASNVSVIQDVFENVVPNIGVYFPFIRYAGDFYQEKVSTKFIASDTILVLEEVIDYATGRKTYVKPFINASSDYSLVFQPANNSEIKIIDKNSEYEIKYAEEAAFAMSNTQEQTLYAEPFAFAVAFQADEEGAYQNFLGIYMRSLNYNTHKEPHIFFMGAIAIKTEVEGEDERFRTLLTNFGVPDPVNYSNIFSEADFEEEGKDYELINKKSKELMLSYDQIFSYVGTYKALIRAIKYLGYQDIIFKEWYTIKDINDKLTDIAVQVIDTQSGNFLKQKLADHGVSIEDFNNYNKINKISMIYHFNEQSDDIEMIKTTLVSRNPETHEIEIVEPQIPRTFISDVPMVKPIYAYRQDETLQKLYAVKRWLEEHIIGVGAYISDITGEGIYFNWQKTQGYSTQHWLNDFSQEQYYTPDVKTVFPFINSKGKIACTLNELNNAVRFIDYDEMAIAAFDKYDISINVNTNNNAHLDVSVLTISNSFEAPVLGDEYEFDLINKPSSGTLYEWSNKNSMSQILIQDGEIKLFDEFNEAYIDTSCLPIITLENANIHKTYGDWTSNIKWTIREVIDSSTGNSKYQLKNIKAFAQNSNSKIVDKYIVLEPVDSSAYIKYTENNKWELPMFIIHGYKFANIDTSIKTINDDIIDESEYYNLSDEKSDYILEIQKGDFLFKKVNNCGCQLSFTTDQIQTNYVVNNLNNYVNEQSIVPTYTYHSERKPFVNINSYAIQNDASIVLDTTDQINDIIDSSLDIINLDNLYAMNIKSYNQGISSQDDIAYNDAVNYMLNASYLSDMQEFLDRKIQAKEYEIMDNALENIISDNYEFNQTIDVEVTRLGDYELITRAFDKYNNTFVAKYDNKITVSAAPIAIDSYIYSDKSNNKDDFYKLNINGILLSNSDTLELLENCDDIPKYPKSYHISDIDYDLRTDVVEFENISYAIDTPKNNDYVIFDTLNEKCIGIDVSIDNSIYRLKMLDENPNKIFLYADCSLSADNKKVSIFAYNKATKNIVYILNDLIVNDYYLVDTHNDLNYQSDSYIDVYSDNTIMDLSTYLNSDNYRIYVLNNTEYNIISDNIIVDYDNRQTYITLDGDQVFNNEDVIKLRYYMDVSVIDNDIINTGEIINETTYRIINIDSSIDGEYVYTLNGLINVDLFVKDNVHTVMTYAAENPVRYMTRVEGRGYEYNEYIGYDNYSIIKDQFKFNNSQMFIDNYIDDTYGIEINDYDYSIFESYWFNAKQYIEHIDKINLYYYHQFPITVKHGQNVIFRPHDLNNVFLADYKVSWKVSARTVDDLDNWDEHQNTDNKEILFRSINKQLPLIPMMFGSHDIQLTCIDIYGNRLVNPGEGQLFVS